ncbi:hypothetical protein CBR_g32322 [Chara braunii]|uniref:Uncharacterized protein n=1 Tax=Chara braunii TaxID=69332 RepID=A0A388JNB3_CHABU|nr:hypothetical protein CBR_g32322 [Chara braunii]|eukprot:GBG59309.1 hypothetical protein CBR_g32322 [Chara braunii]
MPAGAGAGGDTMASEGGGEAADEEQGSTKDSTFSAGIGDGYGKRKNMRQQTFEVVAEVMDKHGALMVSTMDSASKRQCSMMLRQCEILESEVEVQRKHYAAADEANRMMCNALMEIAKAIPAGSSGNVVAVARAREEVPVVEREVMRGDNKAEREDDDPLLSRVRRGGMAKDLAERARLWVDDKAFWTMGERRRLYNIVREMQEYFVAIASGLQTPTVPRSVVMPKSSTTLTRIADPAQLQQAISRAMAVENIAPRVLHRWVFKSGNRPRGFNLAFQYTLESVATDIARVMWYGEEWSNVVSAAVCVHTIDLNMDLPLWFAGANIEDRPEDDDMAAHQ